MIKPIRLQEDVDIFKGVTNDDQFLEAQVKRELKAEKDELEKQKKDIENKLKEFDEKVKREKAKRSFVPKYEFLLREQMERMERLIVSINDFMVKGDSKSISRALESEKWALHGMNIFLATNQNSTDILYDYGGGKIYKKIKQNNADYEGTNKELRKIEVRESDWVQFSPKKSGDEPSGNY